MKPWSFLHLSAGFLSTSTSHGHCFFFKARTLLRVWSLSQNYVIITCTRMKKYVKLLIFGKNSGLFACALYYLWPYAQNVFPQSSLAHLNQICVPTQTVRWTNTSVVPRLSNHFNIHVHVLRKWVSLRSAHNNNNNYYYDKCHPSYMLL